MQGTPRIRPFRPEDSDAVTAILYESSGGLYDRYAGSRRLAERVIARALERDGNTASADVVSVAEVNGAVAGAMAAMAFAEWEPRAYAFLRTTLRAIPPWRWPGALWVYQAGGRAGAGPPSTCFYVDSLATAEPFRRRGVAAALLAHAERRAGELGLRSVALDTWVDNHAALALYRHTGFRELGRSRGRAGLPGGVLLLKELA